MKKVVKGLVCCCSVIILNFGSDAPMMSTTSTNGICEAALTKKAEFVCHCIAKLQAIRSSCKCIEMTSVAGIVLRLFKRRRLDIDSRILRSSLKRLGRFTLRSATCKLIGAYGDA